MTIINSSDCVTEEHEKTREDNSSEDIQVQYTVSLDIFFTTNSNIKKHKEIFHLCSHQFLQRAYGSRQAEEVKRAVVDPVILREIHAPVQRRAARPRRHQQRRLLLARCVRRRRGNSAHYRIFVCKI